jgi:hypothetical protein
LGQFSIDVDLFGLHARSIVKHYRNHYSTATRNGNKSEATRLSDIMATVVLETERVGRDAGRIAEEIISTLQSSWSSGDSHVEIEADFLPGLAIS